jgi:hypothetical protein
LEGYMPVRDGMKNPGIASYAVPTEKLERPVPMVHCEGPNERDYAYLLEYDPIVVSYEEQPCTVAYIFEQKRRLYTPDIAVYWCHQQPSLVECKPASRLRILRICRSGPPPVSGFSEYPLPFGREREWFDRGTWAL